MDHFDGDFERRRKKLISKHSEMAHGYGYRMNKDGLLVVKPQRSSPRLSWRAVVLFLLAFWLFKGFVIANLGPETYNERVTKLSEGAFFERAGAFVMQIDPASDWIARQIGPILRS